MTVVCKSADVAERVARLIFDAGDKRKALADAIGISPQSLTNKLHHRTIFTLDDVDSIADYFAVSTDWLLGREEAQQ